MGAVRTFLRASSRLPLLREAASFAYARYFAYGAGNQRLFRGIYPDFASALADIPANREIGYDHSSSARILLHELDVVTPSEYPTLFWLNRTIAGSTLLFDWGGYIGTTYLTYRKYLTYPPDLSWLVNDVPAVVALGRQTAEAQVAPGLCFTSDFERLKDADILFAAGSLQFIEDPFAILRRAPALPRHVLINKTPVYDRESAVTLQNLGPAIAPYHLFNRREFVQDFERLGYALIDAWTAPGHGCEVPFFPAYSIAAYSGFYFQKIDQSDT